MCDFKVGDEVVCVDDTDCFGVVERGGVYRCEQVLPQTHDARCTTCGKTDTAEIILFGVRALSGWAFCECQFRKVQRRTSTLSIASFLTIKPGQFEEPKRTPAPAKKRERAQ